MPELHPAKPAWLPFFMQCFYAVLVDVQPGVGHGISWTMHEK
jgi:hypothetical protein